ncbi:MAG: hypothetical protein NUV64_01375 [Parcubacteria group bacterium]|nr:hypothetical protein [Parcubacteria group bacterium]MCR4343010.1 hypothetical protein [Patescibacteria group bacterium]
MMKKIFLILILVVVILGLLSLLQGEKDRGVSGDLIYKKFKIELWEEGIARVGQPIEGFDSFLLLTAFPSLTQADFDGVASLEGIYTFDGENLHYERTKGQPFTSAEKTVSDDGYKTLLMNLSKRMGIDVIDESSVNEIIRRIFSDEVENDADTDNSNELIDDETDEVNNILPFDSGVVGKVLLGPICPVVREGDDSCNDKLYAVIINVFSTGNDNFFSSIESDKDGNYKVMLPPGDYVLIPKSGKMFPRCSEQAVTIKPSVLSEVNLSCDTGIR